MSLKYIHVVAKISNEMKMCLEEVPRRGGMYNWMFLFKGSIAELNGLTKKDLEGYDVVQVNLSPVDQLLVQEVRDLIPQSSSTLLIANNDYVCEAWDGWKQHPLQYMHVQRVPDAVFGTEQYQTSQLRDDAYCIPHPHWIKMLKRIGIDDLQQDQYKVGVLYHWWEGRTYTQAAVLQRLRKKYPKLVTRLYAYNKQMAMGKDPCVGWTKATYDKIMPMMTHPDFLMSMTTNRFLYENCTFHTYGRTSVDTAAVGVPTMGTNRVDSMRRCWPGMCCDPFDARTQLKIMDKILSDPQWLEVQLANAYGACEYYNYPNSEDRYMQMVDETRDKIGK